MKGKSLTGIERALVLQYLVDGNVPVTISSAKIETSEDDDAFHLQPMDSAVFPVALKAENVSVLKEGIILLKNPPKSVNSFIGKKIRVEFYFNRVGLYFETLMKSIKAGPAIVIPDEINRIEDVSQNVSYDFTAKFISSSDDDSASSFIDCYPAPGFQLFSRPAWSSIPLEKQVLAKKYLENFVEMAKKNGKAGNGIQLVNICRYLVDEQNPGIQAVQGRVDPFDILFINHERIVLGYRKNESYSLNENVENEIELSFTLKENHFINRIIKCFVNVDVLYSNEEKNRFAADCSLLKLQEEDVRYLYERSTRMIMN